MEISWDDALADEEFRAIISFAERSPRRPILGRDNRRFLRHGYTMVDNQIAFSGQEEVRRRAIARGNHGESWEEELRENEFFIYTRIPFSDPTWRVRIVRTALLIVQRMLPQAASVAPWPVQAIVYVNSALDAVDDGEATVGGVKFILLRPGESGDRRPYAGEPKPTVLQVPAVALFTTAFATDGTVVMDRTLIDRPTAR
jgi:hypothetical protein